MRERSAIVLLVVLLVSSVSQTYPVAAQNPTRGSASVSGEVRTVGGGEPLEAVEVFLEPAGRRALTNAAGRFAFGRLAPGEYRLRFELIGRTQAERAVRLTAGETAHVSVALETSALLLEAVQVTAGRSRRAESAVTAPVSILDREALERAQPTKVGDVFAREPGVEVEGSGPFLGLPVIRGLSGNRVLVLVDGQRLNNAREAINFGGVQPSLVDVDRIERVEILRGPASVLYGSDALGGIVNIITREAPFATNGVRVGGSVSTRYSTVDDGRVVTGEVSVAASRFRARAGASWRAASDFESPEGVVVNSGAESLDLSAQLEYVLSAAQRVRLGIDGFEAENVGLPGTSGVFTGSYPFTDRERFAVEYVADALPTIGSLRLEAYVQNQNENFATVLDLPPISAGPFNLLIDTETERVGDITTLGFAARAATTLGAGHLLSYGVDFFRDDVDERRREETVTVSEPTSPGPPPSTTTRVDSIPTTPASRFQGLGIYLQDEMELGRWRLVPGVRFDRFDIDTEPLVRPEGTIAAEDRAESAVSASLGILFQATPHVHPVLNIGRAFRTPNIIERFFFGPGSQGGLTVPNPELDNETSLNVDVGFKLRFPTFRGSVTYFHNRVDDFITFVPATFNGDSTFGGQPITRVDNVGEVRIQGIEAAAEYLIATGASRWTLFGNFSYTAGEDLKTDQPLFVPPAKSVLGLRWNDAGQHHGAGLSLRAVASQDDVPAGFDDTAGFTVIDVHGSIGLRAWLGRDITLRFGVENVMDRAYREPFNANLSPGRNFELTARVGF
jgi:hemoglobin/transferrin/lactoferrin receptor protein